MKKQATVNFTKPARALVHNVMIAKGEAQRVLFRVQPKRDRVMCKTKNRTPFFVAAREGMFIAFNKDFQVKAPSADIAFAKGVAKVWH